MKKINALEDICSLLAGLNATRLTREAFYLSSADLALILQRFLRREFDAAMLASVADSLHGNEQVRYESGKEPLISRVLHSISSQHLGPPDATALADYIGELTARA